MTTTRNEPGGRFRFLGFLAGVALATLLLDGLVFERLVFAPTNRTSWDSFPWYNFEMQYRRLLRERDSVPQDHRYVLVVGSSIAKYSVQKRELEAALARTAAKAVNAGRPGTGPIGGFTVELFAHAAMLPTDLSFYVERIRALRPDLVLYLTGPADLDLERYAPPVEIAGAGSAVAPGYDNAAAKVFVANRHPMRVFYPRDFASRAYLADDAYGVDLEQALRLGFRESFYSLRFEDAWWDPFVFNIKAAGFGRSPGAPVRSYLNYLGAPIPEGLWREGQTIAQFSFSLRGHRAASGRGDRLRVQIPGELANVPGFHLKIFASCVGGSVAACDFKPARFDPQRGGWQDVPLPPRLADIAFGSGQTDPRDAIVTVQLSHVLASVLVPGAPAILPVRETALLPGDPAFAEFAEVLPRAPQGGPGSGADPDADWSEALRRDADRDRSVLAGRLTVGRGLRLPGNFGRSRLPADMAYDRRPAWEDWRLRAMSPEEYRADFAARIEPPDWRAPRHLAFRQLNQIRLAKYYTNWYEFRPEMQQLQDLARFAREVTAAPESHADSRANPGRAAPRLLIINNPENPLTLAAYDDNRWYRDYLRHMRSLDRGPVRFVDQRSALPANLFLDTHHLSYGGLQSMAPVYAREILRGESRAAR